MIKKFTNSIQTTRFQQYLIFFSIFYVATMLFVQYEQVYYSESNITTSQINEKEKRLASTVEVGLHVNNFPKFSFYKNEFTMDAVLWFRFPIGSESMHTIEKFSFKNGKILAKSEPVVQVTDNNAIISYQVLVEFNTPIDYKNFPVSDHKLAIILQNKNVSPTELNFVSDTYNFEISDDLSVGNWTPVKTYVSSGYLQTKYKRQKGEIQTDFPSIVFTIDFENKDLRHFIILYLPLFLIFFLIFTSLLTVIDRLELRLPIVAGVVPILALHSLVIENISPVGSSITKVDQTYLTLVLLALLILIVQAYIGLSLKGNEHQSPEHLKKKKQKLKLINDIVIIVVLAALVVSMTYSTFT